MLESSAGAVNLRELDVIYVYPRSGRPGEPMLPRLGRDAGRARLHAAVVRVPRPPRRAREARRPVAGLSVQSLDDQREFAERNHMPFPVVSDPDLRLGAALGLPTFEISGLTLYKRCTLVAEDARIVKVFYPVFPPDANAGDVLRWLQNR